MLLRTETPIPSSEITPQSTFEAFQRVRSLSRRSVLSGLGAMGAAAAAPRPDSPHRAR